MTLLLIGGLFVMSGVALLLAFTAFVFIKILFLFL